MNSNVSTTSVEKKPLIGIHIAWIYWFICSGFYFYQFILRVMPNVAGPHLMQDFHLTASQLGGLGFVYFLAYSIAQIPAGLMIDRMGPKKSVLIGVGLCTLGSFVFSRSDNFSLSQLMWALTGIGSASSMLCCVSIASICFPKKWVSLMLSLTICVGSLGGMMGNQFLKDTLSHSKWQDVMEYMSYGMVIVFIATLFIKEDLLLNFKIKTTHRNSLLEQIKIVIKNPQVQLLSLFAFCVYSPLSIIGDSWGCTFLTNVYGENCAKDSSFLYFGVIVGSIIYGVISTRIAHVKNILFSVIVPQFILSAFLVWAPEWIGPDVPYFLFFIGAFNGGHMILFRLVSLNVTNDVSATASSVANMGTMLSGAVLVKAFGVALDYLWESREAHVENWVRVYDPIHYQYAMSLLPATLLIGCITLMFVKHKKAL